MNMCKVNFKPIPSTNQSKFFYKDTNSSDMTTLSREVSVDIPTPYQRGELIAIDNFLNSSKYFFKFSLIQSNCSWICRKVAVNNKNIAIFAFKNYCLESPVFR